MILSGNPMLFNPLTTLRQRIDFEFQLCPNAAYIACIVKLLPVKLRSDWALNQGYKVSINMFKSTLRLL